MVVNALSSAPALTRDGRRFFFVVTPTRDSGFPDEEGSAYSWAPGRAGHILRSLSGMEDAAVCGVFLRSVLELDLSVTLSSVALKSSQQLSAVRSSYHYF